MGVGELDIDRNTGFGDGPSANDTGIGFPVDGSYDTQRDFSAEPYGTDVSRRLGATGLNMQDPEPAPVQSQIGYHSSNRHYI